MSKLRLHAEMLAPAMARAVNRFAPVVIISKQFKCQEDVLMTKACMSKTIEWRCWMSKLRLHAKMRAQAMARAVQLVHSGSQSFEAVRMPRGFLDDEGLNVQSD